VFVIVDVGVCVYLCACVCFGSEVWSLPVCESSSLVACLFYFAPTSSSACPELEGMCDPSVLKVKSACQSQPLSSTHRLPVPDTLLGYGGRVQQEMKDRTNGESERESERV
jgi:hypothetical protein